MTRLSLTPHATLAWAEFSPEHHAAAHDWRGRLFFLAAAGAAPGHPPDEAPVFRFWHSFAESFLGTLCRVPAEGPENFSPDALPVPSEARLAAWLENAPPMRGGG